MARRWREGEEKGKGKGKGTGKKKKKGREGGRGKSKEWESQSSVAIFPSDFWQKMGLFHPHLEVSSCLSRDS